MKNNEPGKNSIENVLTGDTFQTEVPVYSYNDLKSVTKKWLVV